MGLYENMRNEPVSQLALREPVVCGPQDTVRRAIEKMREKKLGCVIIVDDDRKPVGMFTESMLMQLLVNDTDALARPIESHMAEKWPWVKLNDPVVDVLEAMQAKNVRFICVVDDDGRLAGLTGQKGLMEYVADHFPEQVMVQRIGCTPYTQQREGA